MTTGIRNIEQNKFIDPKNYAGFSGIWILGEGVLFDTEEQARRHHGEYRSANGMNPVLFTFNISGQKYFVVRDTNVFD